MSSIGDAKARIAQGSELADAARTALRTARTTVDDAIAALNQAAEGSGHEKAKAALRAYQDAAASLARAVTLLSAGQRAANDYAESLG